MPTLPPCQLLGIFSVPMFLKYHPSPLRHGWELVGGRCHPVQCTQPAFQMHLPAPGLAKENEDGESESEDEKEEDDGAQRRNEDSSESDNSDTEYNSD